MRPDLFPPLPEQLTCKLVSLRSHKEGHKVASFLHAEVLVWLACVIAWRAAVHKVCTLMAFCAALVRSLPSGCAGLPTAGGLLDTAAGPSPPLPPRAVPGLPFAGSREDPLPASSALTALPLLVGGLTSLRTTLELPVRFAAGVHGAGSSSARSPPSLSLSEPLRFRPEPF